jgi:hypothetical protein
LVTGEKVGLKELEATATIFNASNISETLKSSPAFVSVYKNLEHQLPDYNIFV